MNAVADVYLTSDEAAARLKFTVTAPSDPTKAFLKWTRREGLKPSKRGRILLWEPRYLDAFIARSRKD